MDAKSLRDLQTSLNADINAYIAALEDNSQDGERSRGKAQNGIHTKALKLTGLTAIPVLEVYRFGIQGTIAVGIRVAIDLDLFNLVKEQETLESLVQKTGADESLVLRVARMMVAVKIFDEPNINTYKSTPLSKALTIPGCRDWMKLCFDSLGPIWHEVPAFVRANDFKDVKDLDHNPTRQVLGTGYFEDLTQNPEREAVFNSAMSLNSVHADETLAHYPYQQAIDEFHKQLQPAEAAFIVDVGGGSGHYLTTIAKRYPHIPGRQIVQDLPATISAIPPNPGFEPMVHDFFKPQPVHGAKFYHLRHVLHDWPDSACIKILKQLRPAFKPGYSKLLLNGFVLPNSGADLLELMMDLNMWVFCGMERNEMQWSRLLGEAGFKIVRIIRAQVSSVAIIEAVLDDEQFTRPIHML